jgi:hypothetical protein
MNNKVRSARSPDTSAGAFHRRRAQHARAPEPHIESERRELAHRSNGGIDVMLYWHPALDELTVGVRDQRHGAYFEIRPQRHLALDVYNHPYAYADSQQSILRAQQLGEGAD